MTKVERWPKLLHGPIELSDCVAQGEPDRDTVTLAARLTAGKHSLGVKVVVNDREAAAIQLHAEPSDAYARRRRSGFEMAKAPLTPEEFRGQVEPALVVRADYDCWLLERAPGIFELGAKSDLPERMAQLRRWLGLPEYEPVPRSAVADPLPLVLPPPGPATGLRIAVAVDGPEPAIWRRLEVRSDVTLAGLHRILTAAFDRAERPDHRFGRLDHRFETRYGGFSAGGERDGDRPDDEVTFGQVATAPGHRLVYESESWEHWVRVEQVVGLPGSPSCLDGERAAPPEECEDEQGYRYLLEALREPDDEQNAGLLEEFGVEGGFDPRWFDPVSINDRLARLR